MSVLMESPPEMMLTMRGQRELMEVMERAGFDVGRPVTMQIDQAFSPPRLLMAQDGVVVMVRSEYWSWR